MNRCRHGKHIAEYFREAAPDKPAPELLEHINSCKKCSNEYARYKKVITGYRCMTGQSAKDSPPPEIGTHELQSMKSEIEHQKLFGFDNSRFFHAFLKPLIIGLLCTICFIISNALYFNIATDDSLDKTTNLIYLMNSSLLLENDPDSTHLSLIEPYLYSYSPVTNYPDKSFDNYLKGGLYD